MYSVEDRDRLLALLRDHLFQNLVRTQKDEKKERVVQAENTHTHTHDLNVANNPLSITVGGHERKVLSSEGGHFSRLSALDAALQVSESEM